MQSVAESRCELQTSCRFGGERKDASSEELQPASGLEMCGGCELAPPKKGPWGQALRKARGNVQTAAAEGPGIWGSTVEEFG